jgi:hypothetical protein
MALSVCLLTRNEERNIARVLRSVAGLANQVIVADTGSDDRTASLAGELGATVSQFDWNDDFSAGRNFALRQATGDWVLWLNPDEEVLPESHALVGQCMQEANALAYAIVVRDLVQPVRMDQYTETAEIRLFRRHPELVYTGRVHPRLCARRKGKGERGTASSLSPSALTLSPLLSVQELAQHEGKQVYGSSITIRRHGYLSVLTEAKLRWSARLLALELQDHPDQLAVLLDYGKTLLLLNDPEGHRVLARAVEQILPFRDAPVAPLPQVQVLLEYLLTVSPEQSKSKLSHQEAWELALRWFPRSPPLLWTKAAQLFQSGNFRQAAPLLATLVEFGATGCFDKTMGFKPSIIGDDALMNLGACLTKLGDLDRAESCFHRLLASASHHAKAQENLAIVRRLRQQPRGE